MNEIWKDIKDYEGLYQVSNFGQVRSLWFRKSKILKPALSNDGYLQLVLYKNKYKKSYLVHRLVACAFIENKYNLPMINHKDENKSNNHIDNLEWCDNIYNLNYGNRNKRLSKSLSKPVIATNILTHEELQFESAYKADDFGFDHSSISKCCKGKLKTHKGYSWRYDI